MIAEANEKLREEIYECLLSNKKGLTAAQICDAGIGYAPITNIDMLKVLERRKLVYRSKMDGKSVIWKPHFGSEFNTEVSAPEVQGGENE